jgi:hypothetical protein
MCCCCLLLGHNSGQNTSAVQEYSYDHTSLGHIDLDASIHTIFDNSVPEILLGSGIGHLPQAYWHGIYGISPLGVKLQQHRWKAID